MFYEKVQNEEDIRYVLDRLNKDTVYELKLIFGKNYINKTFWIINGKYNKVFLIRLKSNNEPVGVFGILPQYGEKICGIFFLTTDNLNKGNKITLLKETKKFIAKLEKEYKLIMDSCLKSNKTIVKWLTLLGFKPSDIQDEDFQIYYIGDIGLY